MPTQPQGDVLLPEGADRLVFSAGEGCLLRFGGMRQAVRCKKHARQVYGLVIGTYYYYCGRHITLPQLTLAWSICVLD